MLRYKLAAAAVVGGALWGAWMWLRDTSLFAVEHVKITGVHGPEAAAIRSSLAASARQMTTTDFDPAKLRGAVAQFVLVKDLRAQTSFPHSVRIEVTLERPVAVLVAAGTPLVVARDGTILRGVAGRASLPTVVVSRPPRGRRVTSPLGVAAVALLDSAPSALLARVANVTQGAAGLTAALRGGPALYFGNTSRLHAKWAAVAAVLADQGSRGASYVDVRVPERPAAQVSYQQTSATVAGSAGAQLQPTVAGAATSTSQPAAASGAAGAAATTNPSTG